MTRQTTAPLTHLSLDASNRRAQDVARTATDGPMYDLRPRYQRGSIWTEDQKVALVRSWLTGIPVPAILVNNRATRDWEEANGHNPINTGVGMYAVVDGKQRLETAIAWFAGNLAVPASWFTADAITETVTTDDGPYVTYLGLTTVAQRHTANRAMLPVIESKVPTIAAEADLYLLINGGGTPHTPADMIRAASHASEN